MIDHHGNSPGRRQKPMAQIPQNCFKARTQWTNEIAPDFYGGVNATISNFSPHLQVELKKNLHLFPNVNQGNRAS
jgi:hypothetical protein